MGVGMSEQKQHVDYHRKIALRKNLLEKVAELKGAFYIPFIGDGDIAFDLYQGHKTYGADIDGERVSTAKSRLPDAEIIQADCDAFPFRGREIEYSLADFDAYAYPYKAFREFWKQAKITSPCVLFFTDGEKQAVVRSGHWIGPDGKKIFTKGLDARRVIFNKYWTGTVLPWFEEYIKPWQIVETAKYLRKDQFYWGAIIAREERASKVKKVKGKSGEAGEVHRNKFDSIKKDEYLALLRQGHTRGLAASLVGIHRATVSIHMNKDRGFAEAVSEAESDAIGKVENALFEAAISGNVTAIQVYLYNRNPERWADKRSVRLASEGGKAIEIEYVPVDAKAKLISELTRLAAGADKTEMEQAIGEGSQSDPLRLGSGQN
jgi:hypothetical protein